MVMIHRLRGRNGDTLVRFVVLSFLLRSRARPESVNDHLSGLFRAPSGARIAQDRCEG